MELPSSSPARSPGNKRSRDVAVLTRAILLLLGLTLFVNFFVVIDAGQRGVLMRFGQVQSEVLAEGIHVILPIVHTVQKLSVRVQKHEISAEASSRDLQDVFTDVALNWHIVPEQVNLLYQEVGDEQQVVDRIIAPAVEEVLKAVMAQYPAEELITQRGAVKAGVDQALTERLQTYHIAVDDISLVRVRFTKRFSEAVEAKQIAEQEAKRAEFVANKAIREAEAKVNLARGEAQAHQLLQDSLSPEILQRQAIEKWNGSLPLITGDTSSKLLDIEELLELRSK